MILKSINKTGKLFFAEYDSISIVPGDQTVVDITYQGKQQAFVYKNALITLISAAGKTLERIYC